ncbi:MAG: hypothetical protein POH28_10920 [Acidocella sp.]|nr:hypothetical protein [Acidocella sp.]
MPDKALTTEADLRVAVIDRLIAASLRDGKPAREANLAQWRAIGHIPALSGKPDAKLG